MLTGCCGVIVTDTAIYFLFITSALFTLSTVVTLDSMLTRLPVFTGWCYGNASELLRLPGI